MHYSTFDGTAFAWEGYHYWRDWADYLSLSQDANLALHRVWLPCDEPTPMTIWSNISKTAAPLISPSKNGTEQRSASGSDLFIDSFSPPKRMDQSGFGESNGETLRGGVYWPNGGYVTDPALSSQNLADAARQHRADFRLGVEVVEILKEGGRVKGVRLADGEIHAPVVINVARPGYSFINEMAGVTDEMTITTRPLRQEVVHVPALRVFDFEGDGMIVSDSDIACYCRPEHGNHILVGSEDPHDDHYWTDSDKEYDGNFTDQWKTQAMRYGQRVPTLDITHAWCG